MIKMMAKLINLPKGMKFYEEFASTYDDKRRY